MRSLSGQGVQLLRLELSCLAAFFAVQGHSGGSSGVSGSENPAMCRCPAAVSSVCRFFALIILQRRISQ